ncbi:UDP-N-acetylglucosamine 1-carboxyvinyltransferase [Parablautia muri]|uniref:UDP-N-acetylglucosamine 1-carboxyvinyltransferase n=1 Tax=Parablautia muri TaxID=2320879 RepID=A0A9X5GSR0_9FIRM|nr:UDP-N-acetylglucosamine 1-carboxyvinyltransferase [Parablautia muri]NBJ93429.1 UDP-N-acetylglucosamine 1-carboxyvinyltransferase [Parablautia muri]
MDAIHILGGNALFGETKIQGSKNAVLPVMAAALLIQDVCMIENCPHISDVYHMQQLLESIGCKVVRSDKTLTIDARNILEDTMSGDHVTGMRSSITLLGAMLGRIGEVTMAYPGGCVIGERPIDMHLNALRRMGVVIYEKDGCFTARVKALEGAVIRLPVSSVGTTENVILAAVMAKGVTVIQNAAKEPEIVTLCEFLREAGAVIEGIGGSVLIIQGGHRLHGIRFRVPADRIVAGTYLMSVLGAGGHIFLEDAPVAQMRSMLRVAEEIGAEVHVTREGLNIIAKEYKKPIPYIKTEIYPGFPTDMQSPLMAVLSTCEGESVIEETIFEDRFRIVEQLRKMGASIELRGRRQAVIQGVDSLLGCEVAAEELRGGAALVIAGSMALGETVVKNCHFIERGYEDICRDYRNLGVHIFGK